MRWRIVIFGAALMATAGFCRRVALHADAAAKRGGDATRVPVLVELFTSEGCSDCPPADALLASIDQSQPVANADVIVLSEHVDYWDSDGWKDPYSSHDLTVRQTEYQYRFHLDTTYTPQMVVDGNAQITGSSAQAALADIAKAATADKIPVKISGLHVDGEKLTMHIDAGPANAAAANASGDVWVALADDSDQSSVKAGENSGHVLRHVAVVRRLTKAGKASHGAFSGDVTANAKGATLHDLRIVAFVQQSGAGKVLGVGTAKLSD